MDKPSAYNAWYVSILIVHLVPANQILSRPGNLSVQNTVAYVINVSHDMISESSISVLR